MTNAAFERHKWPKRHAYVVEQCDELPVGMLLAYLPDQAWGTGCPWEIVPYGGLIVIERLVGCTTKWFVMCPSCRRFVESLLRLPGAPQDAWRCRRCLGPLPYASQRYGQRHPLRKSARNFTDRKRRALQREVARQERRRERPMARREQMLLRAANGNANPASGA